MPHKVAEKHAFPWDAGLGKVLALDFNKLACVGRLVDVEAPHQILVQDDQQVVARGEVPDPASVLVENPHMPSHHVHEPFVSGRPSVRKVQPLYGVTFREHPGQLPVHA